MDTESVTQFIGTMALGPGLKILAALAFWFIGRWIINRVVSVMRAALNRPDTHTDHYWQAYFDTNEAIVRVAREAGWPAPTPSQIIRQA